MEILSGINGVTRGINVSSTASEDIIPLNERATTNIPDTDYIQNFMINTWIASFENAMYDKDNPVSPYYESEW